MLYAGAVLFGPQWAARKNNVTRYDAAAIRYQTGNVTKAKHSKKTPEKTVM